MKKTVLMIFAVVMVAALLLTGCVPQQAAPAEEAAPADDAALAEEAVPDQEVAAGGMKIAFINPYVSAPYMAAYANGMFAKAEELGAEVVMMDAEGNSQKAYDLAQSALTQDFDGLMLLSPDTKSSISIVKMVQDADMPLLITNAKADDSVQKDIPFVGADLELQGEMAGQMTLDILGDDGGKVCIIEGPGGHDAAISRSAGFKKVVEGKDGVEILGVQQADWDRALAMQKMEDLLTQFPEIDVVFAHDDNMAVGAVEAIKAANRLDQIKVIGVGAAIDGLDSITNGEMYGTVLQSPVEEGEKSVETMLQIIDGQEVPLWTKLEVAAITKDNVDQFEGTW